MVCQGEGTLAIFAIRLIPDGLLQIWSIGLWYREDLAALTLATWPESSENWAPIGNALVPSFCLQMTRAFIGQGEVELLLSKLLHTSMTIWIAIFKPSSLLFHCFIFHPCLKIHRQTRVLGALQAFSAALTLHDLLVLHYRILIDSPTMHSISNMRYLI